MGTAVKRAVRYIDKLKDERKNESFDFFTNYSYAYVQIRLINLIFSKLYYVPNAYSVFQTYGILMVYT